MHRGANRVVCTPAAILCTHAHNYRVRKYRASGCRIRRHFVKVGQVSNDGIITLVVVTVTMVTTAHSLSESRDPQYFVTA